MLRKWWMAPVVASLFLAAPGFAQEKGAAAGAGKKDACAACDAGKAVALALRCEKCQSKDDACDACKPATKAVKSVRCASCVAAKFIENCPDCKKKGGFCCEGCESKAMACASCTDRKAAAAKVHCDACKGKAQCESCVATAKAMASAACPECTIRTAVKEKTCLVCAEKKAGALNAVCDKCAGKPAAEQCEKDKAAQKAIAAAPCKDHPSKT